MKNMYFKLLPVERVAAIYCAVTSVLMLVMMPRLVDPATMLIVRGEWIAVTVGFILLDFLLCQSSFAKRQTLVAPQRIAPYTAFLRVLGQMVWLGKWYPDTYEFNRSFQNLDHIFAAADQSFFGCQPAIEFSKVLPQAVFSETFNMGYWSYYPMIGALAVAVFWREFIARKQRHRVAISPSQSDFMTVATTIMAAFFLYYFIYIFLPVTGPQFYYQAVGIDEILQGHFPALGTYFSSHTEMLPAPGYSDGLFYHLVSNAQAAGERPTAAFPSSHIGISTIVLLLSRRYFPRLTPFLLPFWSLLCCATVYIQAHYLVDAIAGIISAPFMLALATWLVKGIKS